MAIIQTLLLPLVLATVALVGDGWLGIRLAEADRPTIGEVFPGSPAAKVGMKRGDVIVAINGKATRTVEALFEVFQGLSAGDRVEFRVLRGGKKREFKVRLAVRPVEGRQPVRVEERPAKRVGKKPATTAKRDGRPAFLGVQIEEVDGAIVVTALVKAAPAIRAGLRKGDQLRSINGKAVADLDQLDAIMRGLRARDRIRLGYRRDGRKREAVIVAAARPAAEPSVEGRAPTKRAPTKRRAERTAKPAKKTETKTKARPAKSDTVAGFGSSLESALGKAGRNGRPVLMVFGASWCVNCETLKKSLAHSSLGRTLGSYECVWIDTDQQSALADKYDVESLPHTVILDSKGKTQKTIIGYQPPQILAQFLRSGLPARAAKVSSKRKSEAKKAAPKNDVAKKAQRQKAQRQKAQRKKIQPKKIERRKLPPKKSAIDKLPSRKGQPKRAAKPRRARAARAPAKTAPRRGGAPSRSAAASELQRLRTEIQRLRADQRKQGQLLQRILRELQKKK